MLLNDLLHGNTQPALQEAFSDEGKQLKPLPVRITGDAEYATQMLSRLLSPSVSVYPSNNLLLLTP